MKKLFGLFVMCAVSLCTFAQDVIVTVDGNTIDAKILEVSKTEIRYKEADNLNGPIFILPISDINAITYSNGKVDLYSTSIDTYELILLNGNKIYFDQIRAADSEGVTFAYKNNVDSAFFISADRIDKLILRNGQVIQYNKQKTSPIKSISLELNNSPSMGQHYSSTKTNSMERIYRSGNEYMYGNTYISKREVERILQKYDYDAYEQWRRGNGLDIAGGIFLGIGCGLAIGGLFPLFSGNYILCLGLSCSSFLPLAIGLGCTIGGSSKRNRAIDLYNSNFDSASIRLNFFTTPSEVGVALNF